MSEDRCVFGYCYLEEAKVRIAELETENERLEESVELYRKTIAELEARVKELEAVLVEVESIALDLHDEMNRDRLLKAID